MSPSPLPPTTPDAIDRMIARLSDRARRWQRTGIDERRRLLAQVRRGIRRAAAGWAAAVAGSKGVEPGSELEGEDWLAGPMTTARWVRLLERALAAGGQPRPPGLRAVEDRWVAEVVPYDLGDRLLLPGWRAQVWGIPGSTPSQGRAYREPVSGGLAAVLAAGNVSAIGPCDALQALFVDNATCMLKMHPVNEAGGPFIEQAFAPLIDAGVLGVVYGGVDVGRALVEHPGVDTVHMTGAASTYEAIVRSLSQQGEPEATSARTKRVTAELGCVTPILVVPGPWTPSDLEFQARNVAGMLVQNAGHNCNAAKVIVLARGWPLRERFLASLEAVLAAVPPRVAYYPGAEQRYEAMLAHYPDARVLGAPGAGVVPWTLVRDVPPRAGEHALTIEAFCGVLAEISLDTRDADDHLEAAVEFANDCVWGDLSCVLLVDPATERRLGARLERAIAALRYGGVAVNGWPGGLFGLMSTTWGAYPKPALADVQSGVGVVHGALLFDHPEKSVLHVPFRPVVKPVWFPAHRTLLETARRMTEFELSGSLLDVPAIAATALRG